MRSIRAYLLSRLVGAAALVLALASAALYLLVARELEAQLDRSLSDRVQGFASILFQHEDEVEFEFSEQLMPGYDPGPAAAYFELAFADGRLLERSSSLAGRTLAVPVEVGPEPAHWDAPLPDGRAGRHVAQLVEVHHLYPEEGPDRPEAARVRIVIALGREGLVAAEHKVLLGCAAAALVLGGLIALAAFRAVARGLEPARRLAARLDGIHVEHLPARLELGPMPEELAPVAAKADELIARVERALERERRTSANIAHELRTPISEVLTVAEVALRNGHEPGATYRALATIRDVARHMGASVATLLQLARLESGAAELARAPVDLRALLAEALRPLAAAARARGLELDADLAPDARVEGDESVLRIVLGNLLENAFHYAKPGSTVACRLERAGARWRLRIENRTAELARADVASLAEPFWRKDRARADRDHAGLGLALARALVARAGMELAFELEDDLFRATLAGEGAREPASA